MKRTSLLTVGFVLVLVCVGGGATSPGPVQPTNLEVGLMWPIDCIPGGETCRRAIGYPDVDGDGRAFDCGLPGYVGHEGTDILLTSWSKMDEGVSVFAAADGEVLWVFDGKYDRCPNPAVPDCRPPPSGCCGPGESNGYRVCTNLGNYCGTGSCCCYWCFDGGNVVVIRHTGASGLFATRYDHLKRNSILVSRGDLVTRGQKIAEVGSAGNSSEPHLHFEVWDVGFYEPADPWAGPCGPNFGNSLWASDPPWRPSTPEPTLTLTITPTATPSPTDTPTLTATPSVTTTPIPSSTPTSYPAPTQTVELRQYLPLILGKRHEGTR